MVGLVPGTTFPDRRLGCAPVPPLAHAGAMLVGLTDPPMTVAVYGRDGSYSRADTSLATGPKQFASGLHATFPARV